MFSYIELLSMEGVAVPLLKSDFYGSYVAIKRIRKWYTKR